MGQLTKEQSDRLYPIKSNKLYFLTHVKDGGKQLPRCLASVADIADEIIVLVDDETSDNTLEIADSYTPWVKTFEWKHSFGYAKNECIRYAMKHAGLKYGDWCLFMGDDFELQEHTKAEIKDFISNELNFFAGFNVKEHSEDGTDPVTRIRKLLCRLAQWIFWEGEVDEEMWPSAYRETRMGNRFGSSQAWKDFPILGGDNGMKHYGYHEDGGEQSDYFLKKNAYYQVLRRIKSVISKCGWSKEHNALELALEYVLNRKMNGWSDINDAVLMLRDRWYSGDYPEGLNPFYEPNSELNPPD